MVSLLTAFPFRAYKHDAASLEEWISILRLAHKWSFDQVKELSVRFIEQKPLEPLARISLYHQFEVPRQLLVPSYMALINRPEPLNNAEGNELGLETALAIFRAREYARGSEKRFGGAGAVDRKRLSGAVQTSEDEIAQFVRETFFTLPPLSPLINGLNDTSGQRPPPYPSIDTTLGRPVTTNGT
jgi:hypothetical protein